jgi:hypothetical protein
MYRYSNFRKDESSDKLLLTAFALMPLFPEIQSMALADLLKEKN